MTSAATQLAPVYTYETDSLDEQAWYDTLQKFADANIYQTWAYAVATCGRGNVSHFVLRRNGEIVAIAMVRMARLPVIGGGVAYVQWGPLCQRGEAAYPVEVFREAIRGLRTEFVCKRRMGLRLAPCLYDRDAQWCLPVLAKEGFKSTGGKPRRRTIIMDLGPSVQELRDYMRAHWKRELKVAEKGGLEIVEGTGIALFDQFIGLYREMLSRKQFVEPNDIMHFRDIQRHLPEQLKMKVMLCTADGRPCSGSIYSALGNTALYLFGATGNAGMKSRGSYALQWKSVEELKSGGTRFYDLNGINPETNPGTYKFKSDLAGEKGMDVVSLGVFDSCDSLSGWISLRAWDVLKWTRRLRSFVKAKYSSLAVKVERS